MSMMSCRLWWIVLSTTAVVLTEIATPAVASSTHRSRIRAQNAFGVGPPPPSKNDCQWKAVDIPRIHADEIGSIEDFYEKHSETPVIVTGIIDESWGLTEDNPEWEYDWLLDTCGPDAEIPIMKRVHDKAEWADLSADGEMALEDFIHYMEYESEKQAPDKRLYGFDLVISRECPKLMNYFKVPRFGNECLLQSERVRSHFIDVAETDSIFAWPTMMVGPQGSTTSMHVDNEGLPFWMALLKGRKHWRILPYKANYNVTGPYSTEQNVAPPYGKDFRGFVMEEYFGGGTFDFDGFEPDFKMFPELCQAEMHEAVLEAGEVLYVPNSAPHAVHNVDHSVGITANFFHPLDKAQRQWLERNCEDRPDQGFSPEVCRYMFDRIKHRQDNLGPQEDLYMESYLDTSYYSQNFDEEL